MNTQRISASELARNTGAVLNRIHDGETLCVTRYGAEIASIVPAKRTMTAEEAIAGLEGMLTPAQGNTWLKDSRDFAS